VKPITQTSKRSAYRQRPANRPEVQKNQVGLFAEAFVSLNLTPRKLSEKTRELEAKAPLLEAAGKMLLPHLLEAAGKMLQRIIRSLLLSFLANVCDSGADAAPSAREGQTGARGTGSTM